MEARQVDATQVESTRVARTRNSKPIRESRAPKEENGEQERYEMPIDRRLLDKTSLWPINNKPTLSILQYNVIRSRHKVVASLLRDDRTRDFDVIVLQEPC